MSQYNILPVEEAFAIIRSVVRPLDPERVETAAADGRILAEDVSSTENVPPFRASTVDGFAVVADDPARSKHVVQEITAGALAGPTLLIGTAARIMTGAPLPDGADAVVMIEDTHQEDGSVVLDHTVKHGENVRPIGIDVARGDVALRRGAVLNNAELGLLMTLGYTQVQCFRRPVVAVLSTGDELVEPWEDVPLGSIRDSNRYALMAAIREAGGVPLSLGHARDDRDLQTQLLREGVEQADVLITSGGVSVGDRDYIKPALEELGKVHFGRIAFRPGMPLTFAEVGRALVFGLPGNPVSSLVTFEVFVRPTLRSLQGDPHPLRPRVEVELEHEFQLGGSRLEYHRVIARWADGRLLARSTGSQISSRLLSMAGHNALAIIPMGNGVVRAGERLPAILTGPILSE
ncbi:MAG: molybdenum cofactor synthesis domain protein [Chloroflexi bacterium]|nr:molybdenum cofactor synthesis domain protein [Chloroflexota bacterium]